MSTLLRRLYRVGFRIFWSQNLTFNLFFSALNQNLPSSMTLYFPFGLLLKQTWVKVILSDKLYRLRAVY